MSEERQEVKQCQARLCDTDYKCGEEFLECPECHQVIESNCHHHAKGHQSECPINPRIKVVRK